MSNHQDVQGDAKQPIKADAVAEPEALHSQTISTSVRQSAVNHPADAIRITRPDIPTHDSEHKYAGKFDYDNSAHEHTGRYFSERDKIRPDAKRPLIGTELRFMVNDSCFSPQHFTVEGEESGKSSISRRTDRLVRQFTEFLREEKYYSDEFKIPEHIAKFGMGTVVQLVHGGFNEKGEDILTLQISTKSYQPEGARFANLDYQTFADFNMFDQGKHPIESCKNGDIEPERLGLKLVDETLVPDPFSVLTATRDSLVDFFSNPTEVHGSGQGEHEPGKRLVMGGIPDCGGQDKVIEDYKKTARSNGIQGIVVHRGGPPHRLHGDVRTGLHIRSDGAICYAHDESDRFKAKETNFSKESLETLAHNAYRTFENVDRIFNTNFLAKNVVNIVGHYIDGSTIGKELQEQIWLNHGEMVGLTHYLHSHGSYKKKTVTQELQAELEHGQNLKGKDLREALKVAVAKRFADIAIDAREELESYILHHKLGRFDRVVANSKEVALAFKERSQELIKDGEYPRDGERARQAKEEGCIEVDNIIYPGVPREHRPPVERGKMKKAFVEKSIDLCMLNECGPVAVRELAKTDKEAAIKLFKSILENSWTTCEMSRPDSFAKNKLGILKSYAQFIEQERELNRQRCIENGEDPETTDIEPAVYLFLNIGNEPEGDEAGFDFNQKQIKQLHVAIRELGLAEHVIYTSSYSPEEVVELNKNCDSFFSPALTEPFGITSAQALCAGQHTMVTSRVNAAIDFAEGLDPVWYLKRDGEKVYPSKDDSYKDFKNEAYQLRRDGELALMGYPGLTIVEAGRTGDSRMMSMEEIETYCLAMLSNDYHWYLKDREVFYEDALENSSAASALFSWQNSANQLYQVAGIECQQSPDSRQLVFKKSAYKKLRDKYNEEALLAS